MPSGSCVVGLPLDLTGRRRAFARRPFLCAESAASSARGVRLRRGASRHPPEVHRMSRGGSRGKAKPSLNDLSRKRLDTSELDAWRDELSLGSDRAAVLVGAAYLDHSLRTFLRSTFVYGLSERELTTIFEDQGAPLGTFNGRILIAHALGAYDTATRDELHVIRRIRNACAHSPRPITFADPLVLAEAALLRKPEYPLLHSESHSDARNSFASRCLELAILINHASIERLEEAVRLLPRSSAVAANESALTDERQASPERSPLVAALDVHSGGDIPNTLQPPPEAPQPSPTPSPDETTE